jgi:long-subunit acyl-CoA synthetase (AMP-forming)
VVDVPELGFVFPRGEIYARTRTMAREYFKNPQKTAAAFTEDGWFRTGDIGEVHFDEASPGRPHLSVIERRSAIVALKSGAILCPSEVEALLEQYPGVSVAIVAASPHLDHPRCVVESSQLAADHCLKLAAHLKAHGIDEAVIPDAWKFVVPEHESAPSRLLTGEMKQNRRSILATLLAPSANGDNSWHSSATHP